MVAILEEEVLVGLSSKTFEHYENLGYEIPRVLNKWGKLQYIQGSKIKVKTHDLQQGSMVRLTKVCDDCGIHIENQTYKIIIRGRNNTDGKDRCGDCGRAEAGRTRKRNPMYSKTLECYALKNDKEYLLKEFSARNFKHPNEVNSCSDDIFWWNCPDCKSEYDMKMVVRTRSQSNCPYCNGSRVNHTNSLASLFPELAKEWHPILNEGLSPHDITYGSKKEVYWMCEQKHEWVAPANRRTNMNSRCPECSESRGEKVIREWLNENDIKNERQKEFDGLFGINGGLLSYDFYLPEYNTLIEFQGAFHDGSGGEYTKINLHRQQEHDTRKREYAKQNNIELLEIWHWDFARIDALLDNKIKEREVNV